MRIRLFLCGLGIWLGATIVFRVAGQYLLRSGHWTNILILFGVTFPLIVVTVRRLCNRFQLPSDQWLAGAFYLLLPTLFLDPFSSAFFPLAFPNMRPEAAGVFGGLMLWCCASALTGAIMHRSKAL